MVLTEEVLETPLVNIDLSCLECPLMPLSVQRQTQAICKQIETIISLNNCKETAFIEATEAIQQATKHIIESAKMQEEQLLSDLWILYQKNKSQLSQLQNQVSDRIQTIVRLMDNTGTEAMEWSLPSRSENTELIVHRLDDLQQLISKIQDKCSDLITYSPSIEKPTLGSVYQCSLSQYKSPVVSAILSHTYEPNLPQMEHSEVRFHPTPDITNEPEIVNDREETLSTQDTAARSHSLNQILPQISLETQQKPYKNVMPSPKSNQRKIHRSLSARTLTPTIKHKALQNVHPDICPRFLFKLDSIGSEPGQVKQPTDATILPNGNILVADYNNRRLQEFDQCGKSVQLFSYPRIKPKAVTMTRDHFIAIIDGIDHNIKTYTRGAELVCRFGTGYFRDPCVIACNSEDKFVMIDMDPDWQKVVFIYNPMTGTRTWLGFVNNDYLFSNPEGIAVTNNQQILVTDAGHHCVFVFDGKGKFIDKFGSEGQKAGEFWYPKGICVDKHNNILVADCGNHRICLFSQNKEYLCDVIDNTYGVHFPLNICISHTDILAVVQNAEVHVFHVPRRPTVDRRRNLTSSMPCINLTGTTLQKLESGESVHSTCSKDSTNLQTSTLIRHRSLSISNPAEKMWLSGSIDKITSSLELSVLKKSFNENHGENNSIQNLLEDGMII